VLDTNIFVAAGFARRSHAQQIIDAVRAGDVRLVWNEATASETRRVIDQIPPLDWKRFVDLFEPDDKCAAAVRPERYQQVGDPTDRKFAALANAADAVLVSQDSDLLSVRDQLDVTVLTAREFVARQLGG
jgi:predicted nucleic acid-binding protein